MGAPEHPIARAGVSISEYPDGQGVPWAAFTAAEVRGPADGELGYAHQPLRDGR